MRRFLPFVAVFLGATFVCTAQLSLPQDTLDYPPPANMIVANLGGIAVDFVGLTWVHAIAPKHGLGVFGHFLYRPVGDRAVRGYAAGVTHRFHPAGKALWRFHYGPMIGFQQASVVGDVGSAASGALIGFSVGWQWFPERGFAVGFALGESYVVRFGDNHDPVLNSIFGFRPLIFLDLGYAW